jgi:DNA (cytosine-5)-methyltransferase 1
MIILELFAGYGSQALALENLGMDFTSDISEIDKYAIQAYNQLHGETHNWGDITKIDETKLPYYDLITYSSPCQDFSVAGLGKGGDVGSGTRSSLLWEVERIIRAVKPKYLLMENVKNLVGEKHKHNFIRWLHVLEMMGYQNYWKVLNAKDYGVPQNRERVFVVSILGGGQYLFPNPIKLEKRLKDMLESDVDEKYYISQKILERLPYQLKLGTSTLDADVIGTQCARQYANYNGAFVSEPICCASRGRENGQELELNKTGCSNALTSVQKDNYLLEPNVLTPKRTEYGKQIRKEYESGIVKESRHNMTELEPRQDGISNTLTSVQKDNYLVEKNYRIRKLTPRECWRLMGVKDEQFDKLHDISNSQLYKLAGNSIVVDVLMGIFKNLLQSDEGTKGQLTLL